MTPISWSVEHRERRNTHLLEEHSTYVSDNIKLSINIFSSTKSVPIAVYHHTK